MNFLNGHVEPTTVPPPPMNYFDPNFHDTDSCDFLTLLSQEKTPPHEATPLPPCPFPVLDPIRQFFMHIYRYLTYSMWHTVCGILYESYSMT